MVYNPNNELVAKAWIQGIPGVPPNSVATTLPRDNSTWAASGFVVIEGVVGGSSNLYYELRSPVLSIASYATNPSSDKPPWNKANQLAETIRKATKNQGLVKRTLGMPTAYHDAMVLEANAMNEPARRPDLGSYAVYGFELELHWVSLGD